MTRDRAVEVIRGVVALSVLTAVLVGVPVGLYVFGGSPLPDHLPSWSEIAAGLTSPDTGYTLFLAAVRVIGWIAWCMFLLATLTEAAAYAQGRPAVHLPGIGALQPCAARLVATAALVFGTSAPIVTPTTTHPAGATPDTAAAVSRDASPAAAVQPTDSESVPSPTDGQQIVVGPDRRYTVRPGDTLWGIAQRFLGDGQLYQRIAAANYGRQQPDGGSLTDSHWVRPGWKLRIPAETGPPDQQPHEQPRDRYSYTVKRGDTLWDIARHQLGAEAAAAQVKAFADDIFRLNEGRPQPAGEELTDPSLIKSGWTLVMPQSLDAPPPTPRTPPEPAPPPSTRPAPPTARPTRDSRTTTPAPPASPAHRTDQGPSIWLPAGGLIGLGLAAALSIAIAQTRAHRRRRRSPDPDRLMSPEPEPAQPPSVSTARKAHLESFANREEQIPSDADLIRADFTANQPTEIEIGSRRGQPIKVPLGGMSIGLTGPGAVEATRAITTELLTQAHHNRVELLIPHQDADALFTRSTDDLTRLGEAVDGLVMPATEEAAAVHLEAEIIHRARMMERHNQPDVPSLRAADPAEPLPAIVLIAAASDRWAATLDAVLALGPRYCIGALLLGPWPHGTTCHVEADGTISRADGPAADTWTGTQLFHLSSAEAAQMLSVIRTARGTDEQTPPASAQPTDSKQTTQSSPAPPLPEPPEPKTTAQRLVHIHVLGPARVDVNGEPIGTGLRRIAKALLTYLALNPQGVTREQGVEALWPGRDPAGGATMFHTAVNNVRKTLRKASGRREPMFITYLNGRYQLDPQLIDVDLWHVLDALAAASNTEDPTQKITALRRVADLYTAELAEDATYEWAELERERLRRSATDALVALARLLQVDHPDHALAALEQAISHDVYSEPLYRSIMRLQARLDRHDAVRRTYRLLEDNLADLDVDPSSETAQLLNELLQPKAQQERRRTHPPGRRPRTNDSRAP